MYAPWRPTYTHRTNTTQPHHHTHNRRTLLPTPTSHYRPPHLQYRPPHNNYHLNRPTHTHPTTEYIRPRPLYPHTQPLRPHRSPPPSIRPLLPPPPPPPIPTQYIAPDGPTREKAKLYFKIIQAIHHKDIADRAVSSRELPRGMLRQVHKLAHFIKPASPTDTTLHKINDNTTTWMHNNMLILTEHYSHTINEFTQSPQPINTLSLKIATNWAHKRFGHRLLPTTLHTLEHTLSHTPPAQHKPLTINPHPLNSPLPPFPTQTSPHTTSPPAWTIPLPTSPPPTLSHTDFPPLLPPSIPPTNTYTHSRSLYLGPRPTLTELTTIHATTDTTDPPFTQPTPPTLPLPLPLPPRIRGRGRARPLSTINRNRDTTRFPPHTPHTSTDYSPPQLNQPPTLLSPPSPPLPPTKKTHTGPISTPEAKVRTTPPPYTTLSPEFPLTPSTQHPTSTNLKPHKDRIIYTDAQVIHTHNSQPEYTTPHTPTPTTPLLTGHKRTNLIVDLVDCISHNSTSPPLPSTGVNSGLAKKQRAMMKGHTQVNMTSTNPPDICSPPFPPQPFCQATVDTNPPLHTTPPTPPPPDIRPPPIPSLTNPAAVKHHRPTYHKVRTGNKLQDWTLTGHTPTLIIGDSNLNRIPPHTHAHIQIDSYPGATIGHLLHILQKTPTHTHTQTVILSIGLNNMDHNPQLTSIKQLSALYKQALTTFPNATIHFPVINHSPNLTPKQQKNLRTLNSYIVTHLSPLLEIPHDTFITQPDNIHWTPNTAQLILANWCSQLNFQ